MAGVSVMVQPERRAADVKLAVIETELAHTKDSVAEIKTDIKEMKSDQKDEHARIHAKLDKIEQYMSKQRGAIATFTSIFVAVWGVILLVLQQAWKMLTE